MIAAIEHDLWHNHTKVAYFGAHICKIMGIEGSILNCGSCLRSTADAEKEKYRKMTGRSI